MRKALTLVVTWIGFNLAGLAISIAAISAGDTAPRWICTSALFLLSTIAALLSTWADYSLTRLSRRLRSQQIAWAVPLRKPRWIAIGEYLFLLSICASIGAVISLAGLPKAGTGISVALAAFFALSAGAGAGLDDHLVFNKEGLQVQLVKVRFFIRWHTISTIETVGPRHSQMVKIKVKDRSAVVESAEPATPEARSRVESILGPGIESTFVLTPWSAGLDGDTIVRFLREAKEQTSRFE